MRPYQTSNPQYCACYELFFIEMVIVVIGKAHVQLGVATSHVVKYMSLGPLC